MYLVLIYGLETKTTPRVPNNLYDRAKPDFSFKEYDILDVLNKDGNDPSLAHPDIPFCELAVWRF